MLPNRLAALAIALAALAVSSACTHEIYDSEEPSYDDLVQGWGAKLEQAIAVPGRWDIPADVQAIGETWDIEYDGAGPWNGGAACAGGMTDGANVLKEHLLAYFPQIESIGGYNCRPIVGNSSSLSLHGTGRALDIMIPTIGGDADNTAGDEIGNWLIENAEAMGIQMVIWDRSIWRTYASPRAGEYTGQHPHNDHLHVELNENAAGLGAPWFDAPYGPEPCPAIPAEGKEFEDDDACFNMFGNPTYWRYEEGVGVDADLFWTNAFESDEPANWARWELNFETPGTYELMVYVDPTFGVFSSTRYEIKTADGDETVYLDQSDAVGWVSLGAFEFSDEPGQFMAVYDDTPAAVADDQHIVVDAVKVEPYVPGTDTSGGSDAPAGSGDDEPPQGGDGNGGSGNGGSDNSNGTGGTGGPTAPDDFTVDECGLLPRDGGIIDDDSGCFALSGPAEYWRYIAGAGFGQGMYWTDAYEATTPINWARWTMRVTEAGRYDISTFIDGTYAGFKNARYRVDSAEGITFVNVDQSASDGFTSLGVFELSPGQDYKVDIYDYSLEPIEGERTIAVDALQLIRVGDLDEDTPDEIEPASPFVDMGVTGGIQLPEGCSQSGGQTSGALAFLLLPLLARLRSRRIRVYRFQAMD